ncbi:Pycsar system effector family protein [Micromonospora parva]|uniref:Pycsar system effector family protein n=1 Tax=Micromonospora parva TaxID=1464048 RepID=UPI00366B00EF
MTTTTNPPADLHTDLRAEIASVETQLGRVDAKAGLLLGLSGAGATAGPVVVPSAHLAMPSALAAWMAVAALTAAAALLALAVRPTLAVASGNPSGFLRYAAQAPARVLAELADRRTADRLAAHLVDLAAITARKYRRIRLAVDAMLAGIGCAAVAALLALFN